MVAETLITFDMDTGELAVDVLRIKAGELSLPTVSAIQCNGVDVPICINEDGYVE